MSPPPVAAFNFERNMAALAGVNAPAAEFLRHATAIDGAMPTDGRDGAATFSWRDADGRLHWLGRTSMPSISTPALLEAYQPGQGNSLLVDIGQGEEVKQLAARLAAHQAVFVVIEQPAQAVLALRLHDFMAEIAAGRIVLCAGDNPWAQLREFLIASAGYLVPDRMLCRPWYESGYVAELSRRLEQLAREVDASRDEMRRTRRKLDNEGHSGAGLRVALVSNVIEPAAIRLADSIEHAAEGLGWQCRRHTLATPRWVDPRAIETDLRDFQPDVCLGVGAPPGALSYQLPKCPTAVVCTHGWGLAEDWLAQVPGDVMIVLRAPAQMGQLKAAGIDEQRLIHWPPAARMPNANATRMVREKTFVMCDGLDASPEAVGLNLDTHQRLWHESRRLIAAQAATYTDDDAPAILRMAARNVGVAMTSDAVTSGLESRVRLVLGPATVRETTLRRLIDAGTQFEIYGQGCFADEAIAARHRGPWPAPRQSALLAQSCRAVVAIETGVLMPDGVLDCMAAGAVPIQRAAVSRHAPTLFAGIDVIASSMTSFRSADHLVKQLESPIHGGGNSSGGRSWADELRASHTWAHRLKSLHQHLLQTIHRPAASPASCV